ncbi:hypothetical protein QJQ45_025112 [Haematococcus lacustris]|nr:hypothetical protein QJQ45_025112 [Haematococcus lacustris]
MAGKSNIGEKRLEELKKECVASSKGACGAVHEQQQQQVVGVLRCMSSSKSSRLYGRKKEGAKGQEAIRAEPG